MIRIQILFLLLCYSCFGADPVNSTFLIYGGLWSDSVVGVEGGIPSNRTQSGGTISAGASTATIQSALNGAADDTYVLLGAGVFTVTTSITIPPNVTLRGSVDANGRPTTLLVRGGGVAETILMQVTSWDFGSAAGFTTINVSSGATRGSTSITLASDPSTLSVGQVMFISSATAAAPLVENGSIYYLFQTDPCSQQVRVLSKPGGNVVTFEPALNYDYMSGTIRVAFRSQGNHLYRAGLENLILTNSAANGSHFVNLRGADNCWIKNCKFTELNTSTYYIYGYGAYRCSIVHNDFGHSATTSSSSYSIYGDMFDFCLIEDNWFHDQPNPFPMVGLHGCAITYNYFDDLEYSPNSWLSQIMYHHGGHNAYNLLEGNWVAASYNDGFSGGEIVNTLWFRNRMRGDDDTGPKTSNIRAFTLEEDSGRQLTLAGNILGENGSQSQYLGGGGSGDLSGGSTYVLVIATSLQDEVTLIGNYNTVDDGVNAGETVGGSDALVNSYRYSSQPDTLVHYWPVFDPSDALVSYSGNSDATNRIAAAYRATHDGIDPPWSAAEDSTTGTRGPRIGRGTRPR